MRDLFWLTDATHGGRTAGTEETAALAKELRDRLAKAGWTPVSSMPVVLPNKTTSENVIALLGDADERPVLLSAHYDGVGMKDGKATAGASDNAAGVAVVLWVAERLKRDFDEGKLKKPVAIALFTAEEQGLLGSRKFAQILKTRQARLRMPVAAINVDGVGSGKNRDVYLIGRSKYPDLFQAFEKARLLTSLGLGRDIDKFAYEKGSDHWPLHEAGIPAVMIYCADYRAMNTPRDTLARIDAGLVEETARLTYEFVRSLAAK